MGDVAEERPQRDDHLHAERLGEVHEVRGECTPVHRRLDALDEHQVARRSWGRSLEDLDRRPHELAPVGVVELNGWAVGLEVVEVLRIHAGEAAGLQRRGQEGDGARGGVAGVVPALERAHHGWGP